MAGRGPDLNEAIGALKPLLPRLERVMRNISDPQTGIGPFFTALAQSASAVAPVAETQAQMFVDLDTTLAAFADIARPYLQDTISKTPVTLHTASETLPVIRPFLVNSRKLFVNLQPGVKAAAESADEIESALVTGIPVLRASPQLNDQLPPTAAALRRFNDDSTGARRAVRLDRPLRSARPAAQVHRPGAVGLQLRDAAVPQRRRAPAASGTSTGNWQRANALNTPPGPNNEGSPSSAPANGGGGAADIFKTNWLHVNPYPNTASPGQSRVNARPATSTTHGQQRSATPPATRGS